MLEIKYGVSLHDVILITMEKDDENETSLSNNDDKSLQLITTFDI